nr:hypothetical protein [Geomicrobium sp. JCM 19037]
MEIISSHWIYFAGILIIILTMLMRKNVVVPAILMTFLIGLIYTGSLSTGLQTIFNASLVPPESFLASF